jgi:hypothetical protein
MKQTPLGWIEEFSVHRIDDIWRGVVDPLNSNQPQYTDGWIFAKTEKQLMNKMEEACKCAIVTYETALKIYNEEKE